MQAIHYLLIVCGALAAGLPNLAASFPPAATPYLSGATAILVLLTTVLGAVSPSALPSPSPGPAGTSPGLKGVK